VAELQERTAQLEAANAELEAFSYSVSHDLRAPLRHIQGFTEMLLNHELAPEKRQAQLQRIAEAGARMGRLIDQLLAFSRLGRAQMAAMPVPLRWLVDEVLPEVQAEAAGREVRWSIHDLPQVYGDPDLLRQVLVNLLSNAVKYTRPRAVAEIEVGSLPSEGGQAVVYVRDNGVGFDMAYVEKLFGVFQRLHHVEEFEGEGIGLANVRRIVHRHGGRTWAEGVLDGGATFFFTLPLAQSPVPPAQEKNLTHQPGAAGFTGLPVGQGPQPIQIQPGEDAMM
jgi:light-regulated signal transduction histidine kinase (bacteriophytochrome)